MKNYNRVNINLTESQFCALLTGASYAVGAMQRDKSAIEGTIDWIAEASDALREAMLAQGLDEPTDTKGPPR